MTLQLTDNEKAILRGARDNEYGDAFEGSAPWVFAVIDESGLNPKVARGVISSLIQKNLVTVFDYEGKGKADDMVLEILDESVIELI